MGWKKKIKIENNAVIGLLQSVSLLLEETVKAKTEEINNIKRDFSILQEAEKTNG